MQIFDIWTLVPSTSPERGGIGQIFAVLGPSTPNDPAGRPLGGAESGPGPIAHPLEPRGRICFVDAVVLLVEHLSCAHKDASWCSLRILLLPDE